MLRAWIKPLLAAGTAAVVGAYPALADSFAQFVALNQLMDAESAYGIALSHRLHFNSEYFRLKKTVCFSQIHISS
jgi:hypothetical protein